MALLAAAPCCESGHPGALSFRQSAVVHDRQLMLGEVADLSIMPLALRRLADGLVLVRFSTGQRPSRISYAYLSARARGQMPALSPWLRGIEDGSLMLGYPETETQATLPSTTNCLQALRPIAAGTAAQDVDFQTAPCKARRTSQSFVYDRQAGSIRVSHAIVQDELITHYAGYGEKRIRPGDRVLIQAGAGAVRIEREVEALQSANEGQRLFVKTDDGQAFAVELRGDDR